MLEHIRWHEEQHIFIFEEYVRQLRVLGDGQPCTASQALIDTWSSGLQAAQDRFDAQERSWQFPPYDGPRNW